MWTAPAAVCSNANTDRMWWQINPNVSVLWQSTEVVQFGAPQAIALVEVDGAWELELIGELCRGVDSEALRERARRSRANRAIERLDLVLASVERVLLTSAPPATNQPVISVVGPEDLAERFGLQLRALGCEVRPNAPLVVIVDHFVARPDRYQRLLAADVPHLAVLCQDEEVVISQLVRPDQTACLFCLELYRRDADENWTVLACQLLHRRAASAKTLLLATAALELVEQLSTDVLQPNTLTVLSAGGLNRQQIAPHPGCGCGSLPGIETEFAGLAHPLRPSSPPTAFVPA